jgi:hypothetical protein
MMKFGGALTIVCRVFVARSSQPYEVLVDQ